MKVGKINLKKIVLDSLKSDKLLSRIAILGIIFYAVGPVIAPHAHTEQPELIPIYTIMLGAGSVIRDKRKQRDKEEDKDE